MRSRRRVGLLYLAPALAFVAAFTLYPLGQMVWMSLHDFYFTAPGVSVPQPFVGLDNFAAVLADPRVHRSFGNLGIFRNANGSRNAVR